MRTRILIAILIVAVIGCILLLITNPKAAEVKTALDSERYARLTAEEELQKAQIKVKTLEVELESANQKINSMQAVLDQENDEISSIKLRLKDAEDDNRQLQRQLRELGN